MCENYADKLLDGSLKTWTDCRLKIKRKQILTDNGQVETRKMSIGPNNQNIIKENKIRLFQTNINSVLLYGADV